MLKIILILTVILCSTISLAQYSFQLARPFIKYESAFFNDSVKVDLKFAQQGAKIYYMVNNEMPLDNFDDPSEKNLLYKKAIVFKKPFTTFKAKVFCKGFKPSETIELSFAGQGKQIKKITSTSPDKKYTGSGDSTLFDNKGGIENINSKTWMGFYTDSINFVIELNKKETVNSILLSFLENETSWIFLPELILVYYYDESENAFVPFGREVLFHEEKSPDNLNNNINFRFIFPKLENIKTQRLMIDISTVKKMPEWHEAKGQQAWCFIDEIKVY